MSARTALKPAPEAIARAALDETVDRWIGLRTTRAHTPVGFTPAKDLFKDFADWHVAEFPDVAVPAESAFTQSLRTYPKIRFEVLQVQKQFTSKKMALCASLTLIDPIRAVA